MIMSKEKIDFTKDDKIDEYKILELVLKNLRDYIDNINGDGEVDNFKSITAEDLVEDFSKYIKLNKDE